MTVPLLLIALFAALYGFVLWRVIEVGRGDLRRAREASRFQCAACGHLSANHPHGSPAGSYWCETPVRPAATNPPAQEG